MTAAKLAKALNLSRTTVSLVLNGRAERYGLSRETIEKVLSGVKRLNYQPDPVARQLAGMSSNVVGILVSSACVVDARLIERMEILAAERQVRFIVGHAIGDAAKVKEYLMDFRARRVDALVSFHHNHPGYEGAVLDELRQMERVLYYEKPAARAPERAALLDAVLPALRVGLRDQDPAQLRHAGESGSLSRIDHGRRVPPAAPARNQAGLGASA